MRNGNKPENTLSRLLKFAGSYKILIILACVLSAISSVISLCPFICIWYIIKEILKVFPDISGAAGTLKYGWIAVGSALLSIALYFSSLICSHLAAFRVEKNIRKEALHKIITLPLGFFKKHPSGKIRKIIDDNASLTHGFLAHEIPDISGMLIMPVAVIIVLFIFDWRLGLVCLLPLFLSIIFLKQMMGENRANFMKKYMNSLEEMNSCAVEYIRGIPVVKVFQQTIYSFRKFHDSIKNYRDFASNFSLSCRIPMIGFTLAVNAPSLLLIPVGILFIGNAPEYNRFLLDLIFYMLFAPLCTTMMTKIVFSSEHIMVAKEALSRLDIIFNEEALPTLDKNTAPVDYSINFKNVTFSYPDSEKTLLNNLNFTVPDGKTYALVGPSGGGKSTIATLIPGFWDIQKGSIEIGGVNIKHFKESDLMHYISFVFQNSKLFKGTLLENVRIGNKNATEKEMLNALHLVQCDEIIKKLPNGLETIIGSNGIYLSGGETQRISIARAILKNTPIVILDEATAFTDPENEQQIQKAFESLAKNKTVLMIAHRLSSIRNVDKIFVVNNGEIIENGTHDELVAAGKTYCSMWKEYQSAIQWRVKGEIYV